MKSVFLSDAHLKSRKDKGYDYLLRFFDSIRKDTDHLFIVGDFFDFWFCDENNMYPDFRLMVDKILELNGNGVSVNLFEGNHDFFLSDYFDKYDVNIFPEGASVDLDGKRIFVSHGDTVDSSNTCTLFLRSVLRSRLFYVLQKSIPASIMWKVSKMASSMSRKHFQGSSDDIADNMKSFSVRKFGEGYDAVILGHCHQPVMKQFVSDGRVKTFVALGDWITHFSYLVCKDGEFYLSSCE
jgi:UDP-2,3-diacylglucosamine hydrolase